MLFDFNEKKIKKLRKRTLKINEIYEKTVSWSETQLKEEVQKLIQKFRSEGSNEHLENEAFAIVKRAAFHVTGLEAYEVQLIGALILLEGDIAEMKTGEGKTLVSVFPMALRAFMGDRVHLVTANEYLAERDEREMGEVIRYLGFKTALNKSGSDSVQKKAIYQADVIYGIASEFGFDYLRNNLVGSPEDKMQTGLDYVLIDEADSILIDEARTPLIISGTKEEDLKIYSKVSNIVKMLVDKHIKKDLEIQSIWLTDEGIEFVQRQLKIDNLYAMEHQELNHKVSNALRAQFMMKKDIDYIVQEGKVEIIDGNTGRVMEGRRFSEGLHQSIEAKENMKIKKESMTIATVTIQNFFRMYQTIAGMTGTAKTEEEELQKIYNLNVWVVPTNKPIMRQDKEDIIFSTKRAKWNAIAADIRQRHEKGQPILAGTASIEASEQLSDVLKKNRIPHELLNAKNHQKEAEIIAKAGQTGSVTIATNMAGRGTDIKIDDEVRKLGGLCVIGTEKHESRRIDNQLKGRAGRQGDPGESQFYLSLEDDMVQRFQGEKLKNLMQKMGLKEEEPIQVKMINKNILSIQKRMEGSHFDSRKNLIDYDSVLNEQMINIYQERDQVIYGKQAENFVEKQFEHYVQQQIEELDAYNNPMAMTEMLGGTVLTETDLASEMKVKEIEQLAKEKLMEKYRIKKENAEEVYKQLEQIFFLESLDSHWVEHVDALAQLKDGIHLRSYAQIQPLQEYKKEAFVMYNALIDAITKEFVEKLILLEVKG